MRGSAIFVEDSQLELEKDDGSTSSKHVTMTDVTEFAPKQQTVTPESSFEKGIMME